MGNQYNNVGPLSDGWVSYVFITTFDVDAMADFYSNILGFQIVARAESEYAFLKLERGKMQIALYPGREEGEKGTQGMLVVDVKNLDDVVDGLRSRGVKIGEVFEVPFGRAALVKDPEDNTIEIHEAENSRMQ